MALLPDQNAGISKMRFGFAGALLGIVKEIGYRNCRCAGIYAFNQVVPGKYAAKSDHWYRYRLTNLFD